MNHIGLESHTGETDIGPNVDNLADLNGLVFSSRTIGMMTGSFAKTSTEIMAVLWLKSYLFISY